MAVFMVETLVGAIFAAVTFTIEAMMGGGTIEVTSFGSVVSSAAIIPAIMVTELVTGPYTERPPVTDRGASVGQQSRGARKRKWHLAMELSVGVAWSRHDTPLTRMRTRLEEMRRRPHQIYEYETAIDHSIADTDALLETFAALLRIAQIETTHGADAFGPVDVSALIATVVEVYEPLAVERSQSIVGHAGRFTVDGDRELLIQMLGNLVENACKHTPAGTRIQVGAFQSIDLTTLWVQDDGPGIPEDECDKYSGHSIDWMPAAERRVMALVSIWSQLLRIGTGAV